ncbi:MAG: hypothetical protein R3E66_10495 [bacterium]
MSTDKLTRRGFLNVAAGSVGTLTMGYLLAGCQPKEGGGGAAAPAAEAKAEDCTDVSGLSDADKATRSGLQYVDKATDPTKPCNKCALYVAPAEGKSCGGCSVVKGPINPQGGCTAFAPKA